MGCFGGPHRQAERGLLSDREVSALPHENIRAYWLLFGCQDSWEGNFDLSLSLQNTLDMSSNKVIPGESLIAATSEDNGHYVLFGFCFF